MFLKSINLHTSNAANNNCNNDNDGDGEGAVPEVGKTVELLQTTKIDSQLLISQTLISQSKSYVKEYSLDTMSTFIYTSILYLQILISESKLSGTRKFTLRYQ